MDQRGADAGADQDHDRDERRIGEARHADHQAGRAPSNRKARPQHQEPDQSADPDRAGREVEPVEQDRRPLWRRLRCMARQPGHQQNRGRPRERAPDSEDLRDRALPAFGAVDPQREPCGDDEEREHELEVGIAAAERGGAEERDERANVEDRAQSELGRRHVDVDRNGDQRDERRDSERNRERAQPRLRNAPHDRPRGRYA